MTWLPAFKIGLWNAWILMLYFPLHPLIMIVVDKAVGTGGIMKKMGNVPYENKEKRDFMIGMTILILLVVYSVFLPLKINTVWFYAGLVVYLVGLVIILIAIVNIARTPPGQPFSTGMYRYSRHPMIFFSSIAFMGVGLASASWIFLGFTAINTVFQASEAKAEERSCLETFGDAYREYMNRTPRWIGMPKSG